MIQGSVVIANESSAYVGKLYSYPEWGQDFIRDVNKINVRRVIKDECIWNINYDIDHEVKVPNLQLANSVANKSLIQLTSGNDCSETDGHPDVSLRNWWRDTEQLHVEFNGFKRYYPAFWKLNNYITTEPDESTKFISDVRKVDNITAYSCHFGLLGGPIFEWKLNHGGFDGDGLLHGVARLIISLHKGQEDQKGHEDQEGQRVSDVPMIPVLNFSVGAIHGEFTHGALNGMAMLTDLNYGNRIMVVNFKNNILHGPVIIEGIIPLLPLYNKPDPDEQSPNYIMADYGIGFMGYFENNKLVGPFWFQMLGGGYLHGTFDENGRVTGDAIAFIYPDFQTALVGRYEDFIMKRAQEAEVKHLKCHHGMPIIEFTKPYGPHFYFERPTNTSFGAGPHGIVDPFERKWLELRQSSVAESGDGVFAKKNFRTDELAAYFSGIIIYQDQLEDHAASCYDNTSMSDDYRRQCKKYSLDNPFSKATITIPPELDEPGMFHPTLGPKVNHDFLRNNTAFDHAEHARWGVISAVYATSDVAAGQELFGYYGYDFAAPFPHDYPWYWELKVKVEKEERIKMEEEEKKKKKKREKKKAKKRKNSSGKLKGLGK